MLKFKLCALNILLLIKFVDMFSKNAKELIKYDYDNWNQLEQE